MGLQSDFVNFIHLILYLLRTLLLHVAPILIALLLKLGKFIGQHISMLVFQHFELCLSYKFRTQKMVVNSIISIINLLFMLSNICISLLKELLLKLQIMNILMQIIYDHNCEYYYALLMPIRMIVICVFVCLFLCRLL